MTNVNIQTEHIIAYLEGKLSKEDSLAFEKQMLDSPELRKEENNFSGKDNLNTAGII